MAAVNHRLHEVKRVCLWTGWGRPVLSWKDRQALTGADGLKAATCSCFLQRC
jgi:hypothetical protein